MMINIHKQIRISMLIMSLLSIYQVILQYITFSMNIFFNLKYYVRMYLFINYDDNFKPV